jgi:hypothetical protein
MNSRFSGRIILLIFIIFSASLFPQIPYSPGDRIAQAGIGYGMYNITGDLSTPPISAGLQFVIVPEVSLGAVFAYSSTKYKWESPIALQYLGGTVIAPINVNYSYYMTGLRAEYHFVADTANFDGYVGVSGGYTFVSSSFETNMYKPYGFSEAGSYGFFGIHGGLRYYFRPNFAFFGEAGYGLSYIAVGIAYKWN